MNFKKTSSKIETIEDLEKKLEKQSNKQQKPKSSKKCHTLYLDTEMLEELDNFLKEYGFGEKKSDFIETAIKKEIAFRIDQVAYELEEKLKKLRKERK